MPEPRDRPVGTAGEVLALFLRLGLTSFGGPVAHLGYFREAVVERRGRWQPAAALLPPPTLSAPPTG